MTIHKSRPGARDAAGANRGRSQAGAVQRGKHGSAAAGATERGARRPHGPRTGDAAATRGQDPAGVSRKPGAESAATPDKPRRRSAPGEPRGITLEAVAENLRKAQRPPRPTSDGGRARKMALRESNQKERRIEQSLRETRIAADQIDEERLQKALAYSGLGSRRDMEALIEGGQVTVNGKVAILGCRVKPGDNVRVNGKPIRLRWQDRQPRVMIYHKQEGELVSRDDPQGRTTVFDRLPKVSGSQWVAVGRLDFNTCGLLIFTTSGDLANRMMHPRFEVEREYAVRVLGRLTEEQMKAMTSGIELDDGPAHFDRIEDMGGEGVNHWYRVTLKEGRNREVRRMFEHFELTVSRLMRTRFGSLSLPGRLKRGQYHELTEMEVLQVMKWAGLGFAGQVRD